MPVRGMRAESYRTGKVVYDNHFPESPWADFLPKDHARLDNVLFAPLKIQEKVVGVIGLANKPGGFTDQDAQAAGIFGELAAIAFDLEHKILERTTELTRANEQLKNEIKTRVDMQNALEESERKFRAIFNQTFQVIGLLETDGTVLEINQTALDYFGISYPDSVGRPLWDLRGDQASEANRAKFKEAVAQAAGGRLVRLEVQMRFGEETIRTMDISIKPVLNPEGPVHLLIIEGRDITERNQIEMALKESEKQQRLLSSQVLLALENERGRVAQELHDGIGQYLSAIKYRVEHLILTHFDGERDLQSNSSMKNVIPVIQGAIEEVRRICMALRPSTLDDLGILATITWFCREFQSTYSGILIKQKIQVEEQQIPALLKTVIFRIIQEALNNIGKHSQASQIRLNLAQKDLHLHLDIRDNGVGFDLKNASSSDGFTRGMGLAGMKERAKLSGGSLTIHSQPGKGARIQAAWPLGE
jgi:PAS domain S-box-containing protein